MLEPTVQLLALRDADNPENVRLVKAPPKIKGHYVEVADYYTGEAINAHITDLETVEKDPRKITAR